jgi:NADPH:quinone reductase-like Zn-dependent oxidoreductase
MGEKFMRAIVYQQYGSPDVLQLKEVAKPAPQENEVLVKVQAAAANPLDWHNLRGEPYLARLATGLREPKNKILGADIAGWVAAVGANVNQFKPGDEVFGGSGVGGFAEYVCVSENRLARKPANISFAEAAAVPVAALSALQGLREKGKIQPGQAVLINGASGGVGSFAVQIAKAFAADVTGVCSTKNLEMVRALGADHVIDYTEEDFTQIGPHYDLIIDNVGNLTVADFKRALSAQGIGVVIGFTTPALMLQVLLQGSWMSMFRGRKIGIMAANINKQDLEFMTELLEAGKVVPVIDRRYPLSETAAAIRYLEKGHARGKVVITLGNKNKT